uniref:hypothetical protein n=1 Tax=Microbacterium sp. TaxID=51671 RepID=UPI00262C7505
LCAAALGEIPGVRPCAEWGEHRVTCLDHPGYTRRPGDCRGCLPKAAERGFLCEYHYEAVETAVAEWPRWRELVEAAGGRTVSPTGEGGGEPLGYTLLPLGYLAIDECRRHLASMRDQPLHVWVATEEGARDALLFAVAARRAYTTLEVEERPTRFERVRCPSCGLLSLSENPTREIAGGRSVECQHCGAELARVKLPGDRWAGSGMCEAGMHVDCDRTSCACTCHDIGPASRAMGAQALFDGDLAATGHTNRGDWIVYPDHTIHERIEEAA